MDPELQWLAKDSICVPSTETITLLNNMEKTGGGWSYWTAQVFSICYAGSSNSKLLLFSDLNHSKRNKVSYIFYIV